MKEILPKNIGKYVGKKIKIEYAGKIVTADVTMSMGPMYLLVYKGELINDIYKGKMRKHTKMYAL